MKGKKKEPEEAITGTGERVYQAGLPTQEEQDIANISRYLMGIGSAPSGYLLPTEQFLRAGGDLGRTLYEQTLTEARDPYAYYESTLQPQLELTEDYINRQAQRRGLLRSGLPIEQMGRAGVELAIREAEARRQARADALARAAGLTEYMQTGAQQNLANLSNLYASQRQSRLGAAQMAAPYWAYSSQARLGDIYGRQAALYSLPGQALGAAGQIGAASMPTKIKYI